MRAIANTSRISHEEWLSLRRTFIGGSDAAAVVGLSPYSSKYWLYYDKLGSLPPKEDTEAMRLGRDMEDYVAQRFAEKEGKKVRRDRHMYVMSEYPFIGADIDRRVVGENAILECKTTSALSRCDFAEGEIPLHWYCQCMHYMTVVKAERCYLAVLVLGVGFYVFTIEANAEEQRNLLQAEVAFWRDHVEAGIPPAPDGSHSTLEAVKNVYRKGDGAEVIPIDDLSDLLDERAQAKAAISDLEKRVDSIDAQVKARLGDNAKGECQGWCVTWNAQERESVDKARLKELAPDIYKQVVKTSTTRMLRVKERKEA